jgi:hypothetical protein
MTLSALNFPARINGSGGENRRKITRNEKRQNSKIVQPHSLQSAACSLQPSPSVGVVRALNYATITYRFHLITFLP